MVPMGCRYGRAVWPLKRDIEGDQMTKLVQTTVLAIAGAVGLTAVAHAGGFAVREQSTTSQGMSFAGSAANDTLSAMYWNPAGVTNQDGFNSESHFAIIWGDSEIDLDRYDIGVPAPLQPLLGPVIPDPTGQTVNPGNSGTSSGNIAKAALVGASYANYQLPDSNIYLGLSTNAPFGLVTEPDNPRWAGSLLAKTSKIFNLVATPTVGAKVMEGVSVAAGLQVSYLEGTLKFCPGDR